MWGTIKGALAGGWLKIIQAATALIGLAAVYHAIRQGGRDAEKTRHHQHVIDHAQQANTIRRDIDRMPDTAKHQRLRDRWTRDG